MITIITIMATLMGITTTITTLITTTIHMGMNITTTTMIIRTGIPIPMNRRLRPWPRTGRSLRWNKTCCATMT